MGFLSRLLTPRSARRAARPARAVKRAASPKSAKRPKRPKKARYPLAGARNAIERSIATSLRSGRKKAPAVTPVYLHGRCQVKHRTAEAATRCRNA